MLVSATRVTHAGWKVRPGMRFASNVLALTQLNVRSRDKADNDITVCIKFQLNSQVPDSPKLRLKMSIWLSAQKTTNWSFNRLSRRTWVSTLKILANALSSFSLRG